MTRPKAYNAALTEPGAAIASSPSIAGPSPNTLSPSSAPFVDSAPLPGSALIGLDRVVNPNFPHIFAKDVGPAGTGLLTSKSLGPGELVLRDTRPLGYILDTPLLEQRCTWCLKGQNLAHMEAEEQIGLKECGGCNVVRFCNQVGGFLFFRDEITAGHWKSVSIHSVLATLSCYCVKRAFHRC